MAFSAGAARQMTPLNFMDVEGEKSEAHQKRVSRKGSKMQFLGGPPLL